MSYREAVRQWREGDGPEDFGEEYEKKKKALIEKIENFDWHNSSRTQADQHHDEIMSGIEELRQIQHETKQEWASRMAGMLDNQDRQEKL